MTDEALAHARARSLSARLGSGDEWDLLDLPPEDLGLPGTTCELRSMSFGFDDGVVETDRASGSENELTIEYRFSVDLSIVAVMASADAAECGWSFEMTSDGLAAASANLRMVGCAGVTYEGDEAIGDLTYLRLAREDGTVGNPLARREIDSGRPSERDAIILTLPPRTTRSEK